MKLQLEAVDVAIVSVFAVELSVIVIGDTDVNSFPVIASIIFKSLLDIDCRYHLTLPTVCTNPIIKYVKDPPRGIDKTLEVELFMTNEFIMLKFLQTKSQFGRYGTYL